jgi:hypothetical protein
LATKIYGIAMQTALVEDDPEAGRGHSRVLFRLSGKAFGGQDEKMMVAWVSGCLLDVNQ